MVGDYGGVADAGHYRIIDTTDIWDWQPPETTLRGNLAKFIPWMAYHVRTIRAESCGNQ